MRDKIGQVYQNDCGYFDCPVEVAAEIEDEAARVIGRKPALTITEHDSGIHDRGFRYIVYQVSSRRPFDSEVERVARYLDTLAHHWFAALRGQDATRWHIEGFDSQCVDAWGGS